MSMNLPSEDRNIGSVTCALMELQLSILYKDVRMPQRAITTPPQHKMTAHAHTQKQDMTATEKAP